MKHFLLLGLALVGSALLSGCSSKPNYKYLVVFSQCNNSEPYRAAQNEEMKRLWAAQPDVKLVEMDAQQDSVRQIAEIETAIRLKPQLLIVAPNESAPLTEVMGRAMKAGIAVICLERNIEQPNYTTWIRADNRSIGELLGKFVADYLKKKNNGGEPKGVIVELAGLKGNAPEIERKEGAESVWSKYPGIDFKTEKVANWLQSLAKDEMTDILNATPKIDVVYGRNDSMAVGAYLAAKEKGREKDMIFVGIDGLKGDAGGVRKVQQGILAATCIYPLCVDKAVEVGTKILHDPAFVAEKQYTIPSQLVTPANASSLQ
jgi:ribose transport system substrate-binding protein